MRGEDGAILHVEDLREWFRGGSRGESGGGGGRKHTREGSQE